MCPLYSIRARPLISIELQSGAVCRVRRFTSRKQNTGNAEVSGGRGPQSANHRTHVRRPRDRSTITSDDMRAFLQIKTQPFGLRRPRRLLNPRPRINGDIQIFCRVTADLQNEWGRNRSARCKHESIDNPNPVGIVTVRPGGRTAPKPAVQWTVRRRYGRAGSLTTPDGTGRWTGRPSTVDGRGGEFYDAMEYSRSSINLIFPEGSRIELAVNGLMRPRSFVRDFDYRRVGHNWKGMNAGISANSPAYQPSGVPRGPASRNEGWEAGPDGHGTVAASSLPTSGDVAERCSRPSIRPRVDGTPVLTTVRRRDGGLRRPIAQRRDGTVVRPSVRPTVLDGCPVQPRAESLRAADRTVYGNGRKFDGRILAYPYRMPSRRHKFLGLDGTGRHKNGRIREDGT
ncbi:hypothetical protein B0H14DRAFT_2589433 [Mycena olivaceomarginata]|nr:hypothetical protein B0H14DRAFT_2589433 [Mycena olivaceomarginata]